MRLTCTSFDAGDFVWQEASPKLSARLQSKAIVRRAGDKDFIISQFLSGCASGCESTITFTLCDFPSAKTSRTLPSDFSVAVNRHRAIELAAMVAGIVPKVKTDP
jgi:hypothetical protein